MVKANAYGHGLLPVARILEPATNLLCVYSAEEAFALRSGGIRCRILVMGPVPPACLDEVAAEDLEIALWDRRSYVRDVAAAARKQSGRGRIAVHVKIDTGVSRLGLNPAGAAAAAGAYLHEPGIELRGIFSHLAAAEELDSPFTLAQLERFEKAVQSAEPALQAARVRPERHIAASAAAMLWPQTRLDFARIGIAVYGLWPSPQTQTAINGAAPDLRPALSFVSELVAVREVAAGTPVGYGNAYHAPKDTRIGVLPLGYADGIPRSLSNRAAFLVDGARCTVAGRVCMNMTMLDLAAAPRARTGSAVTLIGRDGEEEVTVAEWARWAESIDYEIVARLPERFPREVR